MIPKMLIWYVNRNYFVSHSLVWTIFQMAPIKTILKREK